MFRLKNEFIEVAIAPELGGRIMEFSLSGRNFLFENPLLKGAENVQPTSAWDGKWLNYGGEKIWPAPQGWGDPEREWGGRRPLHRRRALRHFGGGGKFHRDRKPR